MIKDKEKVLLILDEGFPDRVFKTSLFLSLLVIAFSSLYMSFVVTLSIVIGSFIALVLCKVLWWTIQHGSQCKRGEIKKFFLMINIVKYFVVGGILFFACVFLEINATAMAGGFGIVIAVIMMKVGSKLMVNFMNRSIEVPEFKHRMNEKC